MAKPEAEPKAEPAQRPARKGCIAVILLAIVGFFALLILMNVLRSRTTDVIASVEAVS